MSDIIPRRDSESEYVGREGHRQVEGWLDLHGFIPSKIDPDKGEDVLVRIHREGVYTGLTCYIQVKSADDLSKYRLRDGSVSYAFETKALRHWFASQVPVFLIVWDIHLQSGFWAEVTQDMLDGVDDGACRWLEQKTVTVHFASSHKTDANGIKEIYRRVRERFRPLWQKQDYTISLRCEFPPTLAGKDAQQKILRWYECGDPVDIRGEFIKEFKFSENIERLFGPVEFTPQGTLLISPQPSTKDFPFQLRLFSPQGRHRATIQVIMKVIKRGKIEATLTNAHHPSPFYCSFIMREETGGIKFKLDITTEGVRANARDIRDAIPFLDALSKEGVLHIIPQFGDLRSPFASEVFLSGFPSFEGDFTELINKLCFVQEQVGQDIELSNYALTSADVKDINQLYEILTTGTLTRVEPEATVTLDGPTDASAAETIIDMLLCPDRGSNPMQFKVEGKEVRFDMLGIVVDLGPIREHMEGFLSKSTIDWLTRFRADPERLTTIKSLPLVLHNSRYVQEFLQWKPEDEGTHAADQVEVEPGIE